MAKNIVTPEVPEVEEAPVLEEITEETPAEVPGDIDQTVGADFDPETQKIAEYKIVTNTDEGTITQNVRKIVEKDETEIAKDLAEKEQNAVKVRISGLKYKVAMGTATEEDRADLALLLA